MKLFRNSGQKGLTHILLLIATVGVIIFILISATFESRNNLFKGLFPINPTEAQSTYTPRVLLVIYNPFIESQGNRKLTDVKNWQDPFGLSDTIRTVIGTSSNTINYSLVSKVEYDQYPVKIDGFQYTDDTYLQCLDNPTSCHQPDQANYQAILTSVDACGKKNRGEIDEVWIWGGPYFGLLGSNLTGPNAFWYNSQPTLDTTCQSLLPIMGFNYAQGQLEALENYGHRIEATMTKVYGSWEPQLTHPWDKFTLLDFQAPGQGGCGSVNLAVNASSGVETDRQNQRTVSSTCNDFLNYPNLTGVTTDINCSAWGCSDLGYLTWWFTHIPKADGASSDGRLNNWWAYTADPQTVLAPLVTPPPTIIPSPTPTSTPNPFSTPTPNPTPTSSPTAIPSPTLAPTPTPTPFPNLSSGLVGTYFDNINFTGTSVSQIDPMINFDWGGGSPVPQIGKDTFSVRWVGQISPQYSETYTIYTRTDDGVRLWINDQLLINDWHDHRPKESAASIILSANQLYSIRMEYYDNKGSAEAHLSWSSPSTPKQIIPQSRLFH